MRGSLMAFAGVTGFRFALTVSTAVAALAVAPAAHAQTSPNTNEEKASRVPGSPQTTDQPPQSPAVVPDASPTQAPANGDGGGEAIVVTGFRSSLGSALNQKRNETATMDVIKAE